MANGQPLRVAVVSRHPLTRAGLTRLIDSLPERALVVDVAAMDGHLGGQDVALYDLAGLVGTNGNDLTHLLASRMPVVALEPTGRPDLTEGALTLGVADVVGMDISAGDLVTVLENVVGGFVRTPQSRRAERIRALVERIGLTQREAEVLALIAEGLTNKEIAAHLFLSVNSVKTYIRTLYQRIKVTRRAEAVLWAIDHGLGPGPRPAPAGPDDRS